MKFEFEYQCDVPWDEMKGGEKVRHCDKCDRNVHHISGMTKAQALKFLDKHKWEVCVDFVCDSDGEIVFREKERRLGLQLDGAKQLVAMALAVAPLALAAAFIEPDVTPAANFAADRPIDISRPVASVQPSQPVFEVEQVVLPAELAEVLEPAPEFEEPVEEAEIDREPPPVIRPHLRGRIAPRKIIDTDDVRLLND